MSTYEFSSTNGDIKGKVNTNDEKRAAMKAFSFIIKQYPLCQVLNKDHHFIVGSSLYVGRVRRFDIPMTRSIELSDGTTKNATYRFEHIVRKVRI
jgi:hypothetical protein